MKVPARERDGEQRTLYNGRLRDFISTIWSWMYVQWAPGRTDKKCIHHSGCQVSREDHSVHRRAWHDNISLYLGDLNDKLMKLKWLL
jgi:hypothetical protein